MPVMETIADRDSVIRDRTELVMQFYRAWMEHWGPWRARVSEIDALVAGRWGEVFPHDVNHTDLPMVANLFRLTVEDGGRLFAELIPTTRVDPDGLSPASVERAEKREKVLTAYDNNSEFWDQAEYFGQDMIAAGFAAIKVWPNMSSTPEKRFPGFKRIDPRNVLPDPRWNPHEATKRVIVHSRENVRELARTFPVQMQALLERDKQRRGQAVSQNLDLEAYMNGAPEEMAIVDYYSDTFIARTIVNDGDEENPDAEMLVLMDNPTGYCPVQLAARPTWTREPMGQLDDAKGVVRQKNRYIRILTDYFVEMVYGGKLAWNVKNPYDRGAGTIYHALGPDAKMVPVTPENTSFQVPQLLAYLEDAERTNMVAPRSREGDVELNKASAAFLTRAQGQLTSAMRSLQRVFATAKRRSNEAAFAQDEHWCEARKEISGRMRGRRFKTTYRPSVDIKGDYSNRVSYGTTSGLDLPTHNIFMSQKRANRDLSRVTFMENDPTIEDVDAEIRRLRLEQYEEAVQMGFLLPETPLEDRLMALLMTEEGASLAEIGRAIVERKDALASMQQQQQAAVPGLPAGGGGGADAATSGRPGVPGAEAPGPTLPPLGDLQALIGGA